MRTLMADTTGRSRESTENHRIVSRDEWIAERKTLLGARKGTDTPARLDRRRAPRAALD